MKRSLLQVVGSIQCLILNTAFKMAASPELLTVPGTYEQSAYVHLENQLCIRFYFY